ncbi:MAG: protein kinase domain-containing protein [Planctomycetota bacterium]|jgi:tetratricopeptide (TPR) repeat protein
MLCIEEGPLRGVECEVPEGGHVVAGRSRQCELALRDEQVSRMHFRADFSDGELRVTDLESQNGTWVNGKKIAATTVVDLGATLKAGNTTIRVRASSRGYLTGTDLAGYRLERRLGGGGMGEVYRATQVSLGRTVAVKVLSDKLTSDRGFVQRFIDEARSAGKLSHPNVVQVYDVGEEEGRYFISMEYVEGGSVEDLLDAEGKLEPSRALRVGLQTARALEYAERQGIVHCDVKPDNLLLTVEGDVRLSDLGVAKRVGEAAAGDDEGVFGSPHYMSPEQARGESLDHRSDLYSLGATLFRMLAGRTLFTGERSRKVMEKQVFEKPEPIRNVNPAVPQALADIVGKLVEKDPDDRYQSARSLIKDLERAEGAVARAGKARAKAPKLPASVTVRQVRSRGGAASSATATLIKVGVAAAGLLVFGVFLAGYLGRGRSAFDRARSLDEAGRRAEAMQAYREVLRIEAPSSSLAVKSRARLEAMEAEADRERERERCLVDVRAAESAARAGGRELVRAVEKLEVVRDSSVAGFEVAAEPLARLRKRLEAEAEARLRSIRERAAELVTEKRYAEAIRLFSEFPGYYRGLPVARDIDAEGPRIEKQARADWAVAQARVAVLMEALGRDIGALDEARDVLIPFIHRTGMPDIAREAKGLRSQAEARSREISQAADDRAKQARANEAGIVAARALLLEHGYHFDEARKFFRRAEDMYRRQGKGTRADELGLRVQSITRIEILFEMFLRRTAEMALARHAIALPGGARGRVVGARRGTEELVVRTESGATKRVKWDRFHPEEVVTLFRAMKLTPDDRLVLAEFCLEHGLIVQARQELLYASRVRPENAPLAQALKERAQGGAAARPDEDDAKTLAGLAFSQAAEGQVARARELLDLLKTRYAETSPARTRADEIAEAIAAASSKPDP